MRYTLTALMLVGMLATSGLAIAQTTKSDGRQLDGGDGCERRSTEAGEDRKEVGRRRTPNSQLSNSQTFFWELEVGDWELL